VQDEPAVIQAGTQRHDGAIADVRFDLLADDLVVCLYPIFQVVGIGM
jgi:hypothetical protein